MTFAPSPDRFRDLRTRYPEFVYEAYSIADEGERYVIQWHFRMGEELHFYPRLEIPLSFDINIRPGPDVLEPLIFQLGMIELISYWKAACSPSIRILPHGLSPEAVSFWTELYFLGLGEFRYLNGIGTGIENFLEIIAEGAPIHSRDPGGDKDRYLVPIGGGKDSAVSLSLLLEAGKEVIPFMVNPLPASLRTVAAAGINPSRALVFKRTLDPLLLELNSKGFLNGHTPFSALLAFNTLLASSLSGAGRIALSNEASANEATVPGTDINHQYSKSIHFEERFRNYVERELGINVNYFSLLRPLSELQIAGLFAERKAYHPVFRSCNVGSKQDIWCGNCPKCLFTAIILSPFLDDGELYAIFGKDILQQESLKPWLDELAGWSETKPFECVGTIGEVRDSLVMAAKRRIGKSQPLLLRYAGERLQHHYPLDFPFEPDDTLTKFLPPEDLDILRNALLSLKKTMQ